MVKNFKNHNFEALCSTLHWSMAMIRPKSQKFKIGYDGILPIGNFILMIKKSYVLLFQLPGN
jgi:hypothetical protein